VIAQTGNVKVHVDVVQTFSNGSYLEFNAYKAEVILTSQTNQNITYTGFTDDNGFVEFFINVSGVYDLNITHKGSYFKPTAVYIQGASVNYFYEKVYRLAKFFAGDQEPIARKIVLELPCSVVIGFPQSSFVNHTVDSYGMEVKTYQSDTWFTVEPLQVSSPVINPQTGSFIPTNYTVTLDITTVEDGFITFTAVSNGTVKTDFKQLFFLPKEASAHFLLVIFVEQPSYAKSLEDINRKLDEIIRLLIQLISMHNETIIPQLGGFETKLETYGNTIVKQLSDLSGNFSLTDVVLERLGVIDVNVKSTKDKIDIFIRDYPFQLDKTLKEHMSPSFNNTVFVNGAMFLVLCVIIFARTEKKKKSKEGITIGIKQ